MVPLKGWRAQEHPNGVDQKRMGISSDLPLSQELALVIPEGNTTNLASCEIATHQVKITPGLWKNKVL